jgi:D-alanyl-D-alanine carboxypeptidase
MKKIATIIALLIVGICVGVLLWPNRSAAPSTTNSSTATSTPAVKEEATKVSLPGADAIDARLEDYNSPTSIWVVVNKSIPLSEQSYAPSDLTLLSATSRTDKSNDERSIRTVAVADFNDLITAAKGAGYDLIVGSGYRSYDLQAYYYNHYVSVSGEAQANKYSAKPGQSEHQTGLAADITLRSLQCYLDTCFGDTPAGKWLSANAVSYGFIIRYPADKTEITKYQYEPWHIRYVGKPLARALQQSGLTLDEAYPYLQQARTKLIELKKITAQ